MPDDDTVNALMPMGAGEHADNGNQFANQRDAFATGFVNFISADQAPRRAFRGAPYISDEDTARLRQEFPWSYRAGQGAGLVGTSLLQPELGAALLGAAVYNSPTFRSYALPTAAVLAAPYWLLRRAFDSASRNKLLDEE
jgi:hypothetical protein